MSSSNNGPEITNSVGKFHFGKWRLYKNSFAYPDKSYLKEAIWAKRTFCNKDCDHDDSIKLQCVYYVYDEPDYHIWFSGDLGFLVKYFISYSSIYENCETIFHFNDIQAAKDYIDKFLERMNKLIVFT